MNFGDTYGGIIQNGEINTNMFDPKRLKIYIRENDNILVFFLAYFPENSRQMFTLPEQFYIDKLNEIYQKHLDTILEMI